ncbi:MAG: hypothetical protein IKU19_05620 [Clostridia bacterium]|nr:hypothetical protein [Clostridia bacterium]
MEKDYTAYAAEFAFVYSELSRIVTDIIKYLYYHDGEFKGGFSALSVALGKKSGPNGDASNCRNSCLRLEAAGVVSIVWKKVHTVDTICLTKDWQWQIINHFDILRRDLSQMQRIQIAESTKLNKQYVDEKGEQI